MMPLYVKALLLGYVLIAGLISFGQVMVGIFTLIAVVTSDHWYALKIRETLQDLDRYYRLQQMDKLKRREVIALDVVSAFPDPNGFVIVVLVTSVARVASYILLAAGLFTLVSGLWQAMTLTILVSGSLFAVVGFSPSLKIMVNLALAYVAASSLSDSDSSSSSSDSSSPSSSD